jgi:hypothetical protein
VYFTLNLHLNCWRSVCYFMNLLLLSLNTFPFSLLVFCLDGTRYYWIQGKFQHLLYLKSWGIYKFFIRSLWLAHRLICKRWKLGFRAVEYMRPSSFPDSQSVSRTSSYFNTIALLVTACGKTLLFFRLWSTWDLSPVREITTSFIARPIIRYLFLYTDSWN